MTYYVVAHFHYVSPLGAVPATPAGSHHRSEKIVGVPHPETLGKSHSRTTFIGANVTFSPTHSSGPAGMPRRIPDYPDAFAG